MVAAFLAIRAGLRDAQAGRPANGWTVTKKRRCGECLDANFLLTPSFPVTTVVAISLQQDRSASQRVQYDLIPNQLPERHTDAVRANCPAAPGRRCARLLPGRACCLTRAVWERYVLNGYIAPVDRLLSDGARRARASRRRLFVMAELSVEGDPDPDDDDYKRHENYDRVDPPNRSFS
jgi:hypothetical protein